MKGQMLVLPPAWIDNDFLKKVIGGGDTNIEIVSWTTENMSEVNYNSSNVIYRVVVEIMQRGHKEQKSIIIKASREEKFMLNSTEKSLSREIEAYAGVLPQLTKILEPKYHPFTPKCIYAHKGQPVPAIVLEDLCPLGYKHTMPSSGLNMQHCTTVIRKIAQYHASSAVFLARNPQIKNSFRSSVYSEDSEIPLGSIYSPFLKRIAEEVATWPDHKEYVLEKLSKLSETAVDIINDTVKTNENDFVVLNHEGLNLSNIMFQYSTDNEEVLDARFLDFQSVCWGAPGIDFYRFLHSCADPEALEWSHILAEEYYFILEESLSSMGYRHLCPTIAYIYKNFEKSVLFGLILGLVDRALLLADPVDAVDNGHTEQHSINIELSNQFKAVLKKLLIAFHQKGWLQTVQ